MSAAGVDRVQIGLECVYFTEPPITGASAGSRTESDNQPTDGRFSPDEFGLIIPARSPTVRVSSVAAASETPIRTIALGSFPAREFESSSAGAAEYVPAERPSWRAGGAGWLFSGCRRISRSSSSRLKKTILASTAPGIRSRPAPWFTERSETRSHARLARSSATNWRSSDHAHPAGPESGFEDRRVNESAR